MSGSVRFRILSTAGVSWRARGVAAGTTTGRWQDKSAHGAARSVGCFCSCFWRVPHRAAYSRTVRRTPILLFLRGVSHRAEMRHVR